MVLSNVAGTRAYSGSRGVKVFARLLFFFFLFFFREGRRAVIPVDSHPLGAYQVMRGGVLLEKSGAGSFFSPVFRDLGVEEWLLKKESCLSHGALLQ